MTSNFSQFWELIWRMDYGDGWLCTAEGRALLQLHPNYDPNQDAGAPVFA